MRYNFYISFYRDRTTLAAIRHVPLVLISRHIKMRLRPGLNHKRIFGVFRNGNVSGGCKCRSPPLKVKREYYQNCSVVGCVTQCSQSASHSYEQFLQAQQIGFVILGPLRHAYKRLPGVVLL